MLGLAAGDLRPDPALAQLPAVLVVVVAAVGGEPFGPLPRPADAAAHRWHGVDERDQLGDVVAIAPVSVRASGIPVASTKRWCLEPFLPRSTGLGPVAAPPFSPAHDWNQPPPATTQARRPRAARRATERAAAPTRPPAATHPAGDSRSSPSRSQAPAADAATRSPCTAQIESLAARLDRPAAFDLETGSAAPPSATAAARAATARPTRSTARWPSAPLSA